MEENIWKYVNYGMYFFTKHFKLVNSMLYGKMKTKIKTTIAINLFHFQHMKVIHLKMMSSALTHFIPGITKSGKNTQGSCFNYTDISSSDRKPSMPVIVSLSWWGSTRVLVWALCSNLCSATSQISIYH